MKAVLRVWWMFFTAARWHRILGVVGGVLLALGVIGWPLTGGASFGIGVTAFVALAVAPALFSAPAIFRSLSAARMHQLLPHFRLRMLLAVSLLLGALFAVTFPFALGTALTSGLSLWVVGYPFAFLVTVFLLLFLAFGDSRWFVLIALALVLFSGLVNRSVGEPSPATAGMLAALPTWSWSALALGAWAVFAAWYLRVRQVRGIVLTQEGGSQVDATRPVPRTVALRVLLLAPSAPHKEPLLVLILLVVVLMAHALPTFVAPLMMTMFAHAYVASVRQSRLLWLRIPGARDAVRRAIEQALWRHLAMGGVFLVVAAAIAASPLVGHGAAEIALGVASSAGAAIYAAYVALASVRGLATYFWGFGSMALLQIGLMVFSGVFREVFSPHALTAFMVLTAVELAGAALLRALAVRRWRTVDWLRFKPRSPFVGVPRSL